MGISYKLLSALHKDSDGESGGDDSESDSDWRSTVRRLIECLRTLICPPMFADWLQIYERRNRGAKKPTATVAECHDKARKLHVKFALLMALENLILCLPIIVLKVCVASSTSR